MSQVIGKRKNELDCRKIIIKKGKQSMKIENILENKNKNTASTEKRKKLVRK